MLLNKQRDDFLKKTRERYQNFSEEKKNKKCQYTNINLSEEEKEKKRQ